MSAPYTYDIHFPDGYNENQKYPVIFTLHGKGSNEKNMFDLVSPLANQFIIIGIRGDLRLGAGFQYYELKSLGHPIRELFDQSIQKLQDFIAYATERYAIHSQQRYLLGFSQGAILSMSLALVMGEQLRGIVALNGYVPNFVKEEYTVQPVDQISIFISHGEYDQVFPIHIGRETADYWQHLNDHITFHTYPSDHGVSQQNAQDILEWLLSDVQASNTGVNSK